MSMKGILNFMVPGSESSLTRNDLVMIDRDAGGNATTSRGIELESVTVPLRNGREGGTAGLGHPRIELLSAPLLSPPDFLDHDAVIARYYLSLIHI